MTCRSCQSRPEWSGGLCEECAKATLASLTPHGPAAPSVTERTERQVIIDVPRLSAELAELQSRIRSTISLVNIRPAERISPLDFFATQAVQGILLALASNNNVGMTVGTVFVSGSTDGDNMAAAAYELAEAMLAEKAKRDGAPKG